MASDDIPPPHVPAWLVPLTDALLQTGGALWTLCYILIIRRCLADKTYAMPLFALAANIGWEITYGLFIAEQFLEKTAFQVWLAVDVGLVYTLLKFGPREWTHAPAIQRNIGKIFTVLCVAMFGVNLSFARWWIANDIGIARGKAYGGVRPAADTTELGFWSALVSQAVLSVACVAQLLSRWNNRGADVWVWLARTVGTLSGLYVYYGLRWLYWPEAHEYVGSPFALCLAGIGFAADVVYGVLMAQVHRDGAKGKIRPKRS